MTSHQALFILFHIQNFICYLKLFLEFLSCILCVVMFYFQVMNLELDLGLLLPQIILVFVYFGNPFVFIVFMHVTIKRIGTLISWGPIPNEHHL
jgi:hypothetical protein